MIEACVFDVGAEALGFHAIPFEDADALERELFGLGLLLPEPKETASGVSPSPT